MRLARGNRDRPAVVAEATAVEDTVAVAKVASEEATRNSHTALGYFCSAGKACPSWRVSPGFRGGFSQDAWAQLGGVIPFSFLRKFGQGWIRTSEGVKPADLQSAPFGHFGTYPLVPRKLSALIYLALCGSP